MPLIRHDSRLRSYWGIALVPANLIFGTTLSYRMRTGEIIHDSFYWFMIMIMTMITATGMIMVTITATVMITSR